LESQIRSKSFRTLAETAGTILNPSIRKWKEDGGRVIGYFCSSMPEELFSAAGMLPFRMRATGNPGTELSDAVLTPINCTFIRHALNMALDGGYDFLDGLIVPNSCDNIRRMYDHWVRRTKNPFVRMLSLPRKAGEEQVAWFREELEVLKGAMEEHFGEAITSERLREAIRLHNETRRLLRKLYDIRKTQTPPVSGAEVLAVSVAVTALPKAEANRLLTGLLKDLEGKEGAGGHRARLMVMGGELDDPAYLEVIEDLGALVVTDSLCFGARMCWKDVDEGDPDPLAALAQFYVAERPSCPRVFGRYEQRASLVREMIREFAVDGVVLERLSFCDLWGFEKFTIENDFREWGIPLLSLDREYLLSGVGQLRTRVQAFLETIGEGNHGS
jgi:benzoyl-CoA reductase/2-hydroxyglutaryl-CoA dehydratase subunit BcrC/BadD/HgdB